jgi:hypothetical protein
MAEHSGIRIEKLYDSGMSRFPDAAAPIIERIFGLENNYKPE